MGTKIHDAAFVRFSAPDLDAMEAFLIDFGLVRTGRTDDALYMHGLAENPFLHAAHPTVEVGLQVFALCRGSKSDCSNLPIMGTVVCQCPKARERARAV
jgi:hypothetical protein